MGKTRWVVFRYLDPNSKTGAKEYWRGHHWFSRSSEWCDFVAGAGTYDTYTDAVNTFMETHPEEVVMPDAGLYEGLQTAERLYQEAKREGERAQRREEIRSQHGSNTIPFRRPGHTSSHAHWDDDEWDAYGMGYGGVYGGMGWHGVGTTYPRYSSEERKKKVQEIWTKVRGEWNPQPVPEKAEDAS